MLVPVQPLGRSWGGIIITFHEDVTGTKGSIYQTQGVDLPVRAFCQRLSNKRFFLLPGWRVASEFVLFGGEKFIRIEPQSDDEWLEPFYIPERVVERINFSLQIEFPRP